MAAARPDHNRPNHVKNAASFAHGFEIFKVKLLFILLVKKFWLDQWLIFEIKGQIDIFSVGLKQRKVPLEFNGKKKPAG